MPGTITIPTTSLPPGTYPFPAAGGQSLPDGDSSATITIDRTVASGLNSVTSAVVVTMEVDQSNDGGTTWEMLAFTTCAGGSYTTKAGGTAGPLNSNYVQMSFVPGTGRKVRGVVTVTGGTVALGGTLVTA